MLLSTMTVLEQNEESLLSDLALITDCTAQVTGFTLGTGGNGSLHCQY